MQEDKTQIKTQLKEIEMLKKEYQQSQERLNQQTTDIQTYERQVKQNKSHLCDFLIVGCIES